MVKRAFMQGNEAIAEAAIFAGAKFFGGYPITPSSEVAEVCSRRMLEVGGTFMQMEDELASMASIIGASLSGAKSLTATSGPGFSLMQENLGMAIAAEVPCVIVNVQRSGPSTGLATKPAQADMMQVRWGRHGDQTIVALTPASVQECFDLTIQAFNISERLRTPVVLLADETIGHMRENVEIPDEGSVELVDRKVPTCPPADYYPFQPDEDGVPPLAKYGSDYIFHVTSSMHGIGGYSQNDPENARWKIKRLQEKIHNHYQNILYYKETAVSDAEVLIITYGATTRAAQKVITDLRSQDKKVGLLQLQTIWPFPEQLVHEYSKKVKKIVVPEMNLGQIVKEIERVIDPAATVTAVLKSDGTGITPEEISACVMEVY